MKTRLTFDTMKQVYFVEKRFLFVWFPIATSTNKELATQLFIQAMKNPQKVVLKTSDDYKV